MRLTFLLALSFSLQACSPQVEFADVSSTDPRPRPNACVAGAPPKFVAGERKLLSPAPTALGPIVLDPQANRALLIGGLISSGVHSQYVSVLDLASLEHRILSLEGDSVKLPTFAGAIWDPENQRAVLIGGMNGGPDLAQVFTVRIKENSAFIERLPDFPAGPVFRPAAAYDPIGKRVLVTAHVYTDDVAMGLAYRATYALNLEPGAESWSTLVPSESGPAEPQLGETREMVYDPAQDRMVLVSGGTKTGPGDAWILDLHNPQQWIGLSGTFPNNPMFSPPLVWDEVSCSLLYFSRAGITCGFDAWAIDAPGKALESSALGNAAFGSKGPGYGTVLLDTPRDRLLILGGGNCDNTDFLDTVEIIAIER